MTICPQNPGPAENSVEPMDLVVYSCGLCVASEYLSEESTADTEPQIPDSMLNSLMVAWHKGLYGTVPFNILSMKKTAHPHRSYLLCMQDRQFSRPGVRQAMTGELVGWHGDEMIQ
jgi:hypothetical protein